MVQNIKNKSKANPKCQHFRHIDENQVGVCKKCGDVKAYPSNKDIEASVKKMIHRNTIPEYGIPKSILEGIHAVL